MDILHLVDRFEALVMQSRSVPLSGNRLLDESRALELIDQMRISVPDEVKKAKRIHQERDRIIAQAHEEAKRVVDLATAEAEKLVDRDTISAAAEQRAKTIVDRARQEAARLKADADTYILRVLGELEENLIRSLTVVRNGLDKIERDQQLAVAASLAAAEPAAAEPAAGEGGSQEETGAG